MGPEVGMNWQEFLVAAGNMYLFCDEDSSVDTASPKEWIFSVGTKPLMWASVMEASAGIKAELFEGPTYSAIGSDLSAQCVAMNRAAPLAILSKVYGDPTVTGAGTRLAVARGGGTSANDYASDVKSSAVGWVFKPDTKYLLRITPVKNTTQIIVRCPMGERDPE